MTIREQNEQREHAVRLLLDGAHGAQKRRLLGDLCGQLRRQAAPDGTVSVPHLLSA